MILLVPPKSSGLSLPIPNPGHRHTGTGAHGRTGAQVHRCPGCRPSFLSPSPGTGARARGRPGCRPSSYTGARDLNSGPHTDTASLSAPGQLPSTSLTFKWKCVTTVKHVLIRDSALTAHTTSSLRTGPCAQADQDAHLAQHGVSLLDESGAYSPGHAQTGLLICI